jgi:hypothetical protein
VKKRYKNTRKSKMVLFLFKVISTHLNTCVESFRKFLKTVGKGLHRNSVQLDRYDSPNVVSILKPLSFEGSFHLTKRENAIDKTGTVLTGLDEVLS